MKILSVGQAIKMISKRFEGSRTRPLNGDINSEDPDQKRARKWLRWDKVQLAILLLATSAVLFLLLLTVWKQQVSQKKEPEFQYGCKPFHGPFHGT